MNTIVILIIITFSAVGAQAQTAADIAVGKTKFQQLCSACHGATGKGDGPGAMGLTPKPRDLSDATFLKSKTDVQLEKVIKEGGPANGLSPLMPPWGAALNAQEMKGVIAYIRSLRGGQ